MEIKATLCYIIKDGKVLLTYGDEPYAPHYHLYNGLGGKFEKEDDGDQDKCAVRECREEAGVEPIGMVLLGLVTFFGFGRPDMVYKVWVYRANDYKVVGQAGKQIKWFPLEPIAHLPVLPVDKLVHLPLVAAGKYFTATVCYQGREFIRYQVEILNSPPSKE